MSWQLSVVPSRTLHKLVCCFGPQRVELHPSVRLLLFDGPDLGLHPSRNFRYCFVFVFFNRPEVKLKASFTIDRRSMTGTHFKIYIPYLSIIIISIFTLQKTKMPLKVQ